MANSVTVSGIRTALEQMNISAKNGASSGTVGGWEQTLYSVDMRHGKVGMSNNALDKSGSVGRDYCAHFKQGDLQETHVYTHYAIPGYEGVFMLKRDETDAAGDETGGKGYLLTRAGDFSRIRVEEIDEETGEETDVYYLGYGDGCFVMGPDGEKVKCDSADPMKKLDIAVFNVKEHGKLIQIGESRCRYDGVDEPELLKNADVKQCSLEVESVDMGEEAVRLAVTSNRLKALFQLFGQEIEGEKKTCEAAIGSR
ncbi:hypothetical protein FACS189481_4770 [Clostridia bacterium]|nr:hypothetical protein FACS189481_4770 [Clostridia bacterium]